MESADVLNELLQTFREEYAVANVRAEQRRARDSSFWRCDRARVESVAMESHMGIVVRKAAAALSAPGCDTFAVRRSLEAWADQRASLRMRAATTCTGGRFVIR